MSPVPPDPLTFGRCSGCRQGAIRRAAGWWHDPGQPCPWPDTEFVPRPPFDPIGSSWVINDPEALLRDLPEMTTAHARSAARALLSGYTRAFDAAGILDVASVLTAGRRLRDGDPPEALTFDGEPLSSDYPLGNRDDEPEEESWTAPTRVDRVDEPQPPPVLIEISDEEPEEEIDDSPMPLTP